MEPSLSAGPFELASAELGACLWPITKSDRRAVTDGDGDSQAGLDSVRRLAPDKAGRSGREELSFRADSVRQSGERLGGEKRLELKRLGRHSARFGRRLKKRIILA